MDADIQHNREPNSILLDLDNLSQYTIDLEQLGDISFGKRTVQRKRSKFRVFVNPYWNIPYGKYLDRSNKVRFLRTPTDVRSFMLRNDYYDPEFNPSGTKGSPDEAAVPPSIPDGVASHP